MIYILVFIFLCYTLLITSLAIGFSKMENFVTKALKTETKFSVIIPFRNEAKHLPELLASILKLNYPIFFFEIILVDDASTDKSVLKIQEVLDTILQKNTCTRTDIQIIKNQRQSNSPKKDAISTAVKQAKYDWILTCDADCIVPKNWLRTFDCFIQEKKPKMIVAPVSYEVNNSFLAQFQLLDFYSLQAATIGGFGLKVPFLCNGANLCYSKKIFNQLNGFSGNDQIASGDDIFLFEKFIMNDKNSVQFLKSEEVIVKTFPVNTWKNLINQRVRWAAKTSSVQLWFVKIVGLVVFCANFSLLLATLFALINALSILNLLLIWCVKITADYWLLKKSAFFFNQKKPLKWFVISSLYYPFFSVFVVLKSALFTYQWKGRNFKK